MDKKSFTHLATVGAYDLKYDMIMCFILVVDRTRGKLDRMLRELREFIINLAQSILWVS